MTIIISMVSAIIALISAGASIYFNTRNQKQYNRSLEPALSFKLVEYESILYLQIINTGKSAAHDIEIHINRLENNGNREELMLDTIFNEKFELYEGETTQGSIALWGENIMEHTFPKLFIDVKYKKHITQKYESFSRKVFFCPSYGEKVYANVNLDLRDISQSISSIARANLRTANYLDGCQIAPYDELNILAHKSLHDDMLDIQKGNMQSNVTTRENSIKNCILKQKRKNIMRQPQK